jgi:hypothetical protein
MKDVNIQPPQVGERISRRYLVALQELAEHQHVPDLGIVGAGHVVMPPREVVPADDELYWCMLMEAHPGQNTCFDIIVGTWCPAEHKFRFDCDTLETDYETGIDFHYGVPYPTEAGARGWFKRMESTWTDSGYIYVCVSLDCESPGTCSTEDEDLPCLTPETDPCAEA